jgi:hypothetical protein
MRPLLNAGHDPAEYVAIARAVGVDPYELLAQAENEVGGRRRRIDLTLCSHPADGRSRLKLPLQIAALDASIGRIADLQGSPREQPESAGDRALGLTGYRLISARTRRSNDVSTGRPRRKAVDSLGFVDRPRPIHESAPSRTPRRQEDVSAESCALAT